MVLTQRLIGYLTRTFNRSPDGVDAVAFAYTGVAASVTWTVTNAALAFTADGAPLASYSLEGKTLAQLVAEVDANPDLTATLHDATLAGIGAWTLLDATADITVRLKSYTALEWTIFDAIAKALADAWAATGEALRQLVISTAEGEWLDFYAARFGFTRQIAEDDAALRRRVIATALRVKSSNLALEELIFEIFGVDVRVVDIPWALPANTMHTFGGQLWAPDQITNDVNVVCGPGALIVDQAVIEEFALELLPDGTPAWGNPANGNRLQCAFAVIFGGGTDDDIARAILDTIREIRAGGTVALSYIESNLLLTNTAGHNTNDQAYVTGPAVAGITRYNP